MANLPENEVWEDVYQWETSDRALGGPGGVMNKPLRNLVNRTAYLKKKLDDNTGAATTSKAGIVKLNNTISSESENEAATANTVRLTHELASLANDKAITANNNSNQKLDKSLNLSDVDSVTESVNNLGLGEVAFLEEILHRQGNLYEIFISGADAQADSRKNLGLKSAAICDVGTGTWQIPDMSSQGVTYTAGGGIQYFSNGLMRQWGTSGAIGGSGNSIDITFPVPFPNGIHQARTFDAGNPDASINLCMIGVTSRAGMKIWGGASISAAGPALAPLNPGKGTLWEVWGN